ncbi:MAG TPA: response regulator transcription factor [Solirubrobacteraceae bacterium]|nr:response regulator transcription factor [Solirubrobacteraceae bacterium]
MTISVLIADDEPLVRAGLRTILEPETDLVVVADAADGRDALAKALSQRPDVVLMDVRMPRMDGLEATERILQTTGEAGPRIIVLTTFDLDDYLYGALRVGASGFLLKNAPPEQIVEAIRVVSAGEALLAPSITRRVIHEFARRSPRRDPPAAIAELTARELETLKLVAQGLSNTEIAAQLIVTEATVKSHVGRILMKLNLRDRVQAVVLAYETGLVHPGASPTP